MRLTDDARETMRDALMLAVDAGDPEDEESPEERALRDRRMLGAMAWLDAPGIVIKVSPEDLTAIIEALDYTANDYAYRAEFEDDHTADNATEEDREEQREYEEAADQYSVLSAKLANETQLREVQA